MLGPVPLHLTEKERSTLATILALLALGLIGMAVIEDKPAPGSETVVTRDPAAPRQP